MLIETECDKSGNSGETVGKTEKFVQMAQCLDTYDHRNIGSCIHRWSQPILIEDC